MKHVLWVLLFVAGLACAENLSYEIRPPVLHEGLKDCQFYSVRYERPGIMPDNILYITRCPNSSASVNYQTGKQQVHSLTVEDIARESVLKKLTKTERQLLGLEK